jgi:hypothetical protein
MQLSPGWGQVQNWTTALMFARRSAGSTGTLCDIHHIVKSKNCKDISSSTLNCAQDQSTVASPHSMHLGCAIVQCNIAGRQLHDVFQHHPTPLYVKLLYSKLRHVLAARPVHAPTVTPWCQAAPNTGWSALYYTRAAEANKTIFKGLKTGLGSSGRARATTELTTCTSCSLTHRTEHDAYAAAPSHTICVSPLPTPFYELHALLLLLLLLVHSCDGHTIGSSSSC